jgi:hypothetical protein
MIDALRRLRRGELLLGVLVFSALVAVAILGTKNDETATDTYSTSDFRSGGYAAFFTLLQREGVAVVPFEQRPAELDASVDTLIVAYPPGGAATDARLAPDRAALRRWVRAGGRLIALGTADPLAAIAPRTSAASLPPGVGAHALRTSHVGRGQVVIAGDPRRFDNARLANAGNARAAYALAQPRRPGGIVAFDETLHGTLIDRTWWQAMDAPQRVALGGIVLAILVALAGGALRLGPAVTLRAAREPASDEFVAAIAALYARSNARRAAIVLLAHGAQRATGEAATQLRALAERQTPTDRDLIASARLARIIREGH